MDAISLDISTNTYAKEKERLSPVLIPSVNDSEYATNYLKSPPRIGQVARSRLLSNNNNNNSNNINGILNNSHRTSNSSASVTFAPSVVGGNNNNNTTLKYTKPSLNLDWIRKGNDARQIGKEHHSSYHVVNLTGLVVLVGILALVSMATDEILSIVSNKSGVDVNENEQQAKVNGEQLHQHKWADIAFFIGTFMAMFAFFCWAVIVYLSLKNYYKLIHVNRSSSAIQEKYPNTYARNLNLNWSSAQPHNTAN